MKKTEDDWCQELAEDMGFDEGEVPEWAVDLVRRLVRAGWRKPSRRQGWSARPKRAVLF